MPTLAEVSTDLDQISSLLTHVTSISMKIGGFGDGPHLREQIQADVRQLTNLSQKVKIAMAELSKTNDPSFDTYQVRFDELRTRIQSELKPVVEKLRGCATPSGTSGQPSASEGLLRQDLLDADTDYLDTLEQQVNEILQAMREVNQLFTRVMTELQKQRHILARIDAETTEAASDMSSGNMQLEQAAEHQRCSTKLICCIFLIVFVIAAGIGGIIAWQVLKKKDTAD
jgi:hypothetical protein